MAQHSKKKGKGQRPSAEASDKPATSASISPDPASVARNETLKSGESFWKAVGRFQPLR